MHADIDEAPPLPPTEPGPFDCCGNECGEACVWTIYWRHQQAYEAALAAWQARHPQAD